MQLLVLFQTSVLILRPKLVVKTHESGRASTIVSSARREMDCALPGIHLQLSIRKPAQFILRLDGPALTKTHRHFLPEPRQTSP